MAAKTKKQKRGSRRRIPAEAVVHVHASFNNTIITFTDQAGNVMLWGSSGTSGFKGNRKGTPYAAQLATENVAKKALDLGVVSASVRVRGPGSGRDSSVRALHAAGIKITEIEDITPLPHNGCRPPKRRRD